MTTVGAVGAARARGGDVASVVVVASGRGIAGLGFSIVFADVVVGACACVGADGRRRGGRPYPIGWRWGLRHVADAARSISRARVPSSRCAPPKVTAIEVAAVWSGIVAVRAIVAASELLSRS